MRALITRLARPLLTWMARAALDDGCTPETVRDGQGAGPLSNLLAVRMAEIEAGS